MKKTILTVLTMAALLRVSPAGADEIVRAFKQQIPVGSAAKVALDFPVGEVRVEAWDESKVDLDVKIECDRPTAKCKEASQKLRLVYDNSGDRLRVEIKDWPRFATPKGLQVNARVRVPRELALGVDLGVGELTVTGLQGDVSADLGVGEVSVTLPRASVGSVNLDTGVGEANLVVDGRRYESSGLVAKELRWNKGAGRSGVTVDCGVGEIDVRLE
jgi:hypothetical protein